MHPPPNPPQHILCKWRKFIGRGPVWRVVAAAAAAPPAVFPAAHAPPGTPTMRRVTGHAVGAPSLGVRARRAPTRKSEHAQPQRATTRPPRITACHPKAVLPETTPKTSSMGTPPRIATPRCGLEQRWAGALAWPQAAAPGARGLAAGPHLAQCLSAARHALERPRHLGPPAPTAYRLSQTCAALGPPRCVATKAHRAGGAVAAGPPAPPAWRRVSTGMRAGGSQRREGRRTTHGGKSLWQGLECARDGTMRPMLQSANHGTTRQQLGDVGRNTASHRADSVASCFQRRQQQESLGTPVTTGTAVPRTCRCRPIRGATCARLGGPRVPVLRRRNAPRWPVTSPGTAGATGPSAFTRRRRRIEATSTSQTATAAPSDPAARQPPTTLGAIRFASSSTVTWAPMSRQ